MEKGKGELSAVQEVKKDFGINVYSIVTMEDIIDAVSYTHLAGCSTRSSFNIFIFYILDIKSYPAENSL